MGIIRTVDRSLYIVLRLLFIPIRIAWVCSVGILFAGFYLALGVLMSPFGMVFGGAGRRSVQTALNIWLLTPGKSR